MMEITNTEISFLGAIAGGLSISIAVYLQMMVKRRCDPKWILAYTAVGVVLIMLNLEVASPGRSVTFAGQIIAYLAVIAIEITGLIRIVRELEIDNEVVGSELLLRKQ